MKASSILASTAITLAAILPAAAQERLLVQCSADSGRGAVETWNFDISLSPLTITRSRPGALTAAVAEPLCYGEKMVNLLAAPSTSRCEIHSGVIFVRGSVAGMVAQNYRIDLTTGHYEADWGYGIREGRCQRLN